MGELTDAEALEVYRAECSRLRKRRREALQALGAWIAFEALENGDDWLPPSELATAFDALSTND